MVDLENVRYPRSDTHLENEYSSRLGPWELRLGRSWAGKLGLGPG